MDMPNWCNDGENEILNVFFKGTSRPAFYLGLYCAPTVEPSEDVALTALTEPAGGGYARLQLPDADWSVVADLASHVQKTFSCSGAAWGNVYGWFICNAASGTVGKVYAVGNFADGPYNVPDGGAVKVTPKITAA
jgi:hypothetical protein